MYEEVDLRPYLEALLARWYWIVGATVVTTVLTFLATSFLPPVYEASTLVAITEARQQVQFDPRFQQTNEELPLRAYPQLAVSDELLQQVLVEVAPLLEGVDTIEQLRGMLETGSAGDPTLIRLLVHHSDPATAAEVANIWTAEYISWVNQIYGTGVEGQLEFFQEQLGQAEAELDAAEEALVEFEARNRTVVLRNRLHALERTQAQYLREQQAIRTLNRDIAGLRTQLDDGTLSQLMLGEQLAALTLQLRAYNSLSGTLPIQMQLDPLTSFEEVDREDQIAAMEQLATMLESRLENIEGALADLEPVLLQVQQELEQERTVAARLDRRQQVATETYIALARKVEEERISTQNVNQGVRLASRAVVPDEAVGPRHLMISVAVGALSFLLVTLVVLVLGIWFPLHDSQSGPD